MHTTDWNLIMGRAAPLVLISATLAMLPALVLGQGSAAPRPAGVVPVPAGQIPGTEVPFRLVKQHIMLDVTVNGSRPLAFILDTGDTFGIVDLDVARELGLGLTGDVAVDGIGSKAAASRQVAGATYGLPQLPGFKGPIVIAMPLHNLLSNRLGEDLDGIVGGDFIRKFVVEIDYAAGKVILHDKDAFSYTGPGESLPLEYDQERQPVVRAEVTPVGGKPLSGRFKIDTGAQHAIALHSPFVAKNALPGEGVPTIDDMRTGGVAGESSSKVARLSELKIGSFKFERPIALFASDKSGAFANGSLQGNIGAAILARFRVFLDYSHNRMILEPASTFHDPFDRAFAGMGIEAEGKDHKTFVVKYVQAKSAAADAGVAPGDVIRGIDNRPAAGLTLTEIFDQLQQPVEVRLLLGRGEREVPVTLTPRRLE